MSDRDHPDKFLTALDAVPNSPYFSISTAMAVRCAGGMNAFTRSSLTAADLSR